VRGLSLSNPRGVLVPVAVAAALAATAVATAKASEAQPLVAAAVPAVLITALLCARWPAAAFASVLVFSGTFGSLQAFGYPSPGPIVDLLLGGLWVAVLVSHLINGRDRPWWIWPGVALALVYIAITLLEVLTAASIEIGLRSFRFSAWYMLAFPLLALGGWRLATYVRVSRGMVAIAVLVGGYATFRLIVGPAPEEEALGFQGRTANVIDGELALIGSFPSRHTLAFWAACATPLCLATALTQRRGWRLAGVLGAGLCVVAVLGSEVRSALPAIVIGAAVVILLYQLKGGLHGGRVGGTAVAAMVAVIGGAGLFTVVVDENSTNRYDAILNPSGDFAWEQRLKKWGEAVRDIERHPFGQGLGTAGRIQEERKGPYTNIATFAIDSSYLKIAYEQGFPLLILFGAAMLALLGGLAKWAIRADDDLVHGLAAGAAGTLAAGLCMFFTGDYIEDLVVLALWIPVGAGVGALAAARAQSSAPRSPIDDRPGREAGGTPPPPELPPSQAPRASTAA
jgi:hypothetical protein